MGRSRKLSYIEVERATKEFVHDKTPFTAFENISLTIERGEFVCILGASGCGKSTLLNALAGFSPVTRGRVTIDGREVVEPSTKYVTIFQNYGLLPWRNVQKNVELGLENRKLTRDERREIASKYIDLVGLSAFKRSYPRQLSGGMQQRVAIARALAVDPEILFMDEPFGALDAITRSKLQDDVRALSQIERKTVVFVTHDITEAVYLADKIVVLTPNPGRVKAIVPVPLQGPRDRVSHEFLEFQNRIFDLFHRAPDELVEYMI